MEFCKDCKHVGYAGWCCNPKLGIDIATGLREFVPVRWVRGLYKQCGPEATWFEPNLRRRFVTWLTQK